MYMEIHYHLSEEGAKQTIQNLSGKKSKYWSLQEDLKAVSAIKELLQKAEKQVFPVSVLFKNAANYFLLHYFPQLKKKGIIY